MRSRSDILDPMTTARRAVNRCLTPFDRWRRVALVIGALFVLAGCRVDVTVDIDVAPDGTGTLTVTLVADAELVDQVPDLAQQIVLDDVVAAGWAVDGPAPTDDGGLRLSLSNDFRGNDEATNLLRSLGPPFNSPELGRGVNGDVTNNSLSMTLSLPDGFAEFADDELVAAVGAVPFADDIAASGATPANALGVVVRADLPGRLDDDRTLNETALDDGRLQWTASFEPGAALEVTAFTEQAPETEGRGWARPLSVAALIALIAWVAFMTLFILYVVVARWRRARRARRRRPPPIVTG